MKTVEAAVIGVGWVGGTRADTLSRTALVDKLHLCEIKPDRLAEVKKLYKPATATLDYNDIIKNDNISVVYISTTPESNHYPICRDCLKSGKNVMLEKPIALELWEADELIQLAKRNNLKFTIGYSQRFNPKIAYAKKKIVDGTLGKVVSVLVSRHLSRSLGKKIASRVRLSPVVMESTHDLDFVLWLLEPAKPVRVYSQGAYGYMQPINGSHDVMFTTVTMDNGVAVMIGGGWNFPPSYPNYCSTWIEITGTEGALTLDDTQRDNWLNTEKRGQEFPMSTMPGEWVDNVFAGGMGPETIHFLEACIRDTPVMVTPESGKAESLGYSARGGLMERAERIIVLCFGLAFGVLVPVLWLMLALTSFTAVQRFVKVWRQASAPRPARPDSRWRTWRLTMSERSVAARARSDAAPGPGRWRSGRTTGEGTRAWRRRAGTRP